MTCPITNKPHRPRKVTFLTCEDCGAKGEIIGEMIDGSPIIVQDLIPQNLSSFHKDYRSFLESPDRRKGERREPECKLVKCSKEGRRRSSGEVFCNDHAYIADEGDP